MVQVTISEELKQRLLATTGVVELIDAKGERIGRLVPDRPADLDPKSVFPEMTSEEIERRCDEAGPRYTTKQVIEHLQSRMKDP